MMHRQSTCQDKFCGQGQALRTAEYNTIDNVMHTVSRSRKCVGWTRYLPQASVRAGIDEAPDIWIHRASLPWQRPSMRIVIVIDGRHGTCQILVILPGLHAISHCRLREWDIHSGACGRCKASV